jgi:hypothetical protein
MHLDRQYVRGWAALASEVGAGFTVQDFTDVPVAECIRRDAERAARGDRAVGADVIQEIHDRWLGGVPAPK